MVADSPVQAQDTGYAWLISTLLPDSRFTAYLSSNVDSLYRFHDLATLGGWWTFFKAAVPINAALALIAAVVAVPLLCLLWKVTGLDTALESVAIDAWLVSAYPFLFHLVSSAVSMEGRKHLILAVALFTGMLMVRVVVRKRISPPPVMVRTATVCGLVLVAVTAVPSLAPQLSPHRSQRPNILLVSIDTLRADHVHCYGYERETTPNIDALAAEGVRFTQMTSSSSWTLPAHVTMLTGIPPQHHGVVNDGTKLGPQVTTLPEVLKGAGYQTAGFVSGVYLLPMYGFDQGFDTYDYSAALNNESVFSVTSPKMEKLTTNWLAQRSEADRQKPFFVFLHFFDVHFDFVPPAPFNRMFDPDYTGPVDGRHFIDNDLYNPNMDPRDYRHLLSLYDGEIRSTDYHLGRVLDYLKSTGELDNTIVVVTADHGEEFFDHGRKGHRMTLFEEVVHVPLVIRYPRRIPAGTQVDDQVRLMDVSATILDLAGVDVPPAFGMKQDDPRFRPLNLMARVEGRPNVPVVASYGELHDTIFSIRTPVLKFVYEPDRDYGQLFDLTKDPKEKDNLYYKEPEESAVLKDRIKAFREGNRNPRLAQPHQVDEEQLKRLRSLGYVH